jgi:hypothetical protein
MEVFLVFFQANDDPQADSIFPGVVDAVMRVLRTSLNPATPLVDPYTEEQSTIFDTGEIIRGRITINATTDQAWNRLDCLLTVTLHELIFA